MRENNNKNMQGSISLFVLLSTLFFLTTVITTSVYLKNNEKSINTQLNKIKKSYEVDLGNEDDIYI